MRSRNRNLTPQSTFVACASLLWAIGFSATASAAGRPETQVVSISERAPAGALIAELSTFSPVGSWRWTIVGATVRSPFQLDAAGNRVLFSGSSPLDFEVRSQYLITLRGAPVPALPDAAQELFAADLLRSGGGPAAAPSLSTAERIVRLRIRVVDAPESPWFVSDGRTVFRFDLANSLCEYSLPASDVDANDQLQFEVVAGDPQGWLACDRRTGRLSLNASATPGMLHGARQQRLECVVRVVDSQGLAADRSITAVICDPSYHGLARLDEVSRHHTAAAKVEASSVAAPASVTENALPNTKTSRSLPTETPTAVSDQFAVYDRAHGQGAQASPDTPRIEAAAAGSPAAGESLTPPVREAPPPAIAKGPLTVVAAGLRQAEWGSGVLSGTDEDVDYWKIVANWSLLGLALLGMAAGASIALRGWRRTSLTSAGTATAAELPEVAWELDRAALQRTAGRSSPGGRSLRAEMADLLAVSQHFTVTQKARRDGRVYSRQFRSAALATIVAGGIALLQGLLGLEQAFGARNWVVLACILIIAAAAARAFLSIRKADARTRTPGPLSGEFQIDPTM